ncbi:DUF302 domain-containing protein [Hydrogenimonas sp.]
MKRVISLSILLSILLPNLMAAGRGMIEYTSRYDVEETTRRLVKIIRDEGVTLFKVIDYGEGAKEAGVKLYPAKLVIFGNTKIGASLMECSRTLGLDLPQKMLIYETEKHKVLVLYNDPFYLMERHRVARRCFPKFQKMTKNLKKFALYAIGEEKEK